MIVSKILGATGSDVITITEDQTVADVAKLLGERRIGAVPVMAGKNIAGIISERDIVRGLAIRGGAVLDDGVGTLMTRSVVTCGMTETIQNLMAMMTERRIRHVPVIDDNGLVGVVTIGDVVKHRLSETEQEAEALKEYIASA